MEYWMMIFAGVLSGVLLWRIQMQETRERKRWYRAALHTKLQNLATGKHIALCGVSYVLGRRRRKCDIPVGSGEDGTEVDVSVSREHARIFFNGENWILVPLPTHGEITRLLCSGFRPVPPLRYNEVFADCGGSASGVRKFRPIGPEGVVLRCGSVFRLGRTMLRLEDADESGCRQWSGGEKGGPQR